MAKISRRRVLRGAVEGSAVAVALPLLNCFLNENGTALASGLSIPVRFGTWSWGLGIAKAAFNPKVTGVGWELPDEIACLKPVQQHLNIFTDYMAYRDSSENLCHYSGWVTSRSGSAPTKLGEKPGETLDVTVANKIGRGTRFKMLTATATGDVRATLSYDGPNSIIPSEFSPVSFYERLFGDGFQDPNAPTFTPNPRVMARRSVLSGVMDDIKDLNRYAGVEDRARLDQYFTGLRSLEHQMDQQLRKPDPIAACKPTTIARPKGDPSAGVETSVLAERHAMMTDLMVMALVCDQTRVFNMFYTAAQAVTVKKGYDKPHHTCTHEEPIDEALGYQPTASWFTRRSMESWLYFVQALEKVKEGDGTLLDNILVFAHSDQGLARVHGLDGMAMFTAGRAGGRVKTGIHVAGKNAPVTEVGYTAMRAVGLDLASWGTKSNMTSKVIGEIIV